MTWESSAGAFVVGDVIEWTEVIWPPKRGRRKQRPWGEQKAIAQITDIDGDFIKLTVLKSEITKNDSIKDLIPHKTGTALTKKCQTLTRGNPQRLHWSEEDVRKALLANP